jgi:hypothetical protein
VSSNKTRISNTDIEVEAHKDVVKARIMLRNEGWRWGVDIWANLNELNDLILVLHNARRDIEKADKQFRRLEDAIAGGKYGI